MIDIGQDLYLTRPALQPAAPGDMFQPRDIKARVDDLAGVDAASAISMALPLLEAINSHHLAVDQRIELLKRLQQPLMDSMDSLVLDYLDEAFPLMAAGTRGPAANLGLLKSLATGWHICLADLMEQSRRDPDKEEIARLLYQVLDLLGLLILNCYLGYREIPEKLWRQLHRLYLFAEHHHLQQYPHAGSDGRTIADRYLHILLLALANPYHQTPATLWNIHCHLARWSRLAELRPVSEVAPRHAQLTVDLGSDLPPEFQPPGEGGRSRILHGERILQTLQTSLEQSGELPESTLRQLLKCWGGEIKRVFSRSHKPGSITVYLGMDQVHALFGPDRHDHENGTQAALVNKSADGMGISMAVNHGGSGARIGEIVGAQISNTSNTPITPGLIRWIRIKPDEQLEFGMQFLGHPVTAVTLESTTPGDTTPQRALLLPDRPQAHPSATLLMASRHSLPASAWLTSSGSRMKVRLTGRLEGSGLYSRYYFTKLE
ncbi:MAG: hypothetical protein A2V90_05675 [Gammaproteobacteria bacterium RBG_16_57_12]|nr:MAG: hypothetical protein A2V90_05675 [Gammaproteobacteria bacterium RBG_16_57_12]